MKTFEELIVMQNTLDCTPTDCPKCKGIASWFEIREFKMCGNCAESSMSSNERSVSDEALARAEADQVDQQIDTFKEEKFNK